MAAACGCGGVESGGGLGDLVGGEAHWCSRVLAWPVARSMEAARAAVSHTVLRCFGGCGVTAGSREKSIFSAHVAGLRSRTGTNLGGCGRLIHKKVIGRSTGGLGASRGRRTALGGRGRQRMVTRFERSLLAGGQVFALHQPARQHGRGIFFQPGIEQLRDFLAEISGMAKARELITLQRVAGRGKKELPRWLGSISQRGLQRQPGNINKYITIVNSIQIRTYCGKLWKSPRLDRRPSSLAIGRLWAHR